MGKRTPAGFKFKHGTGGSIEVLADRKISFFDDEDPTRLLLIAVSYDGTSQALWIEPEVYKRLKAAKDLEEFSLILSEDVPAMVEQCDLCKQMLDDLDIDKLRKGDQEELEAAEAMLEEEPVCGLCAPIFEDGLDQEKKIELMKQRIWSLGWDLQKAQEELHEANNNDGGAEHI